MAIICSCPECGDLELSPKDFTLIRDASEFATSREKLIQKAYQFMCPDHNGLVIKSCDDRILDKLVKCGVKIMEIDTSSVLGEMVDAELIAADPLIPSVEDQVLDLGLSTEEQRIANFEAAFDDLVRSQS
jgi:hypothetical protein